MTKEEKERTISALLWEREGFERRVIGATEQDDEEAAAAANERITQVDAELKKLGATAKKPAARASRRRT